MLGDFGREWPVESRLAPCPESESRNARIRSLEQFLGVLNAGKVTGILGKNVDIHRIFPRGESGEENSYLLQRLGDGIERDALEHTEGLHRAHVHQPQHEHLQVVGRLPRRAPVDDPEQRQTARESR